MKKVTKRIFACFLASAIMLSSGSFGNVQAGPVDDTTQTTGASIVNEEQVEPDASSNDASTDVQQQSSADTSLSGDSNVSDSSQESLSDTTSDSGKDQDTTDSSDSSSQNEDNSSTTDSSDNSQNSSDEASTDNSSTEGTSVEDPADKDLYLDETSNNADSTDATESDAQDDALVDDPEATEADEDLLTEEKSEEASDLAALLESDTLTEEENIRLKEEFELSPDALNASSSGMIRNAYIEASIASDGNYTFGTVEGNPNYTTDNNKKLLYGHPSPWSSETLIRIDGSDYKFRADDVTIDTVNNVASAVMNVGSTGVTVYQNISFYTDPATGRDDTAHVLYTVSNSGSAHDIGVRIMIDTMLANHDDAPFKINGIGNVTKNLELVGDQITRSYQVYDDLDNPTTIAGGTLWMGSERKPDKVQYCNWGGIHGSSWNHTVNTGNNIGDSAVGIYYNPITVAAGSSFTVGTYYGTGIGLSGQDTDDDGQVTTNPSTNIPGDAIDVHVIDPSTRRSVSGVSVSIDGIGTGTTDSNGKVRFSNIDSALNGTPKELTLSATGYTTRTQNITVRLGMPLTVYLRSTNDNSPLVTGVVMTSSNSRYNNIDLLSKTATFTENSEGIEAKDNINKEVVTIKVSADFANGDEAASYQLVQDKFAVMDSTDGTFNIDMVTNNLNGKNYSESRICKFAANQKIYLRVISRNGQVSNLVRLGMDVKKPADATVLLSGTSDAFGTIDFSKVADANQILEIFFGDNKKIKFPTVPVKVKVSEGGKVRVAVTKNVLDKDEFKWDSFKENYNDKYARSIANTSNSLRTVMQPGTKADPVNVGNMQVKLEFEGYGEGCISNGQLKVEVGIIATLSGSASHTHTFFVGWVPLYIKVGMDAQLQASVKAKAKLFGQNPDLHFYWGQFKPSISLYAEMGAGASGILSAGVQGKGTLDATYDFGEDYAAVDLTASAAITVHALLYHNEINIAKKTWNLYRHTGLENGPSATNSGSAVLDNMFDLDSFTLNSREYLEAAPLNTSVDEEMEAGVYTDARPLFVKANGKSYRFWIDDTNEDGLNYTHVVYSVYDEDEKEWSKKKVLVETDNTPDYAFDVSVSGSKIYVAYQEADHEYTESEYAAIQNATGSEGIADLIADSQISLSVLNTADNSVVDKKSVSGHTDESTLGDLSPRVYADGTSAHIIWFKNSANTIIPSEDETETTTTIMYSKVSESNLDNVSAATSVASSNGMITSMDLGKLDGSVQAAYVIDTDGNLATVSGREVYIVSGLGSIEPVKVEKGTSNADLDESPQFVSLNGTDALMWYGSDNYYYTTSTKDAVTEVFAEDMVPSNMNNNFTVVNEGASASAIVWTSTSSDSTVEEHYVSVYGSKLGENGFGQPYEISKISTLEDPMVSSLSGIIENGKIMTTFQLVKYNSDGRLESSSICGAKEDSRNRVEVVGYDFDITKASSGNTLPVTVVLKNTGTQPIDSVTLNVGSASAAIESMNLAPGAEGTFTSDVTLETSSGTSMLTISVDLEDGDVVDATETKVPFNYTNIRVKEISKIMIANTAYFMFTIENNSNIPAEGINFKILTDDQDSGAIAMDFNAEESLGAGETINVFCPVDSLGDSELAYTRLVTTTSEFNKEDNSGVIVVNSETIDTLSACNIDIVSVNTEAGTVVSADKAEDDEVSDINANSDGNGFTGTTLTNSTIRVVARPKETYSFTGWTITGDATVDDRYALDTNIHIGDEDVTVTANFATTNHLTGITIAPELTLAYQEKRALTYTLAPTDTSDHVNWSSSDASIVTVDTYGNLNAVGLGEAIITATSSYTEPDGDPITATCKVTVENVPLEGLIILTPELMMHGLGVQKRMDIITYPLNATQKIEYTSSNPSVVTVNEEGLMTSVATGEAIITAKAGLFEKTCKVTVDIPPQGIYFEISPVTITPAEDYTLRLLANPEGSIDDVNPSDITWSVADTSIATITPAADRKSAVIHGVRTGETRVSVRIGTTLFTTVTVKVKQPIVSLTMSSTSLSLKINESKTLSVRKYPSNAVGEVTWASSDSSVATVTDSGKVTARASGTAIVTATADSGASATCTVTVEAPKVESTYAPVGTTFSANDMNLVVSGAGTATVTSYTNKKATSVNIGSSPVTYDGKFYQVTSIGANAFKGLKKLKSVTLGSNITSIGAGAFMNCKKLKSVSLINSGITSIPKNAFKNCKGLRSVSVNGNLLKSVAKTAFKGTKASKVKVTIKAAKKKTFNALKKKFKKSGLGKSKYKKKK